MPKYCAVAAHQTGECHNFLTVEKLLLILIVMSLWLWGYWETRSLYCRFNFRQFIAEFPLRAMLATLFVLVIIPFLMMGVAVLFMNRVEGLPSRA